MSGIGPQHPLTYRREVVERLFQLIQQRESCAVIGSSSMGKSRLIEFILQTDVQRHFQPDAALLMVNMDSNRLAKKSQLSPYELLLTTLIETIIKRSELHTLRRDLHLCNSLFAGLDVCQLARSSRPVLAEHLSQ